MIIKIGTYPVVNIAMVAWSNELLRPLLLHR